MKGHLVAPKTKTPPVARSVPKNRFTDSEAGALEFPSSTSRTYNYFTPAKLRASTYEDVTFDVQVDPERHLTQGWLYGFADGPGGYPQDWTAAKSSDWHEFRDPNEEWEQTIFRNNANVVRQIAQNVENAKAAGAFGGWNGAWARVVAQHVGAWMHIEQGLGMHVFVAAQRNAPTNMLNNAICVNSVHKLRFAQDLVLYNLEVDDQIEAFDGAAHIQTWNSDPVWQGVRKLVEELTAIADWTEAVVVTNVVFEPLIGELFRSGFVQQAAAVNGDYVTPTVIGAGENDYARDLRYTKTLVNMLVKDATHGAANVALINGWLDDYVPRALAAARLLQPIWSQPTEKVISFETSLDAAVERTRALLTELGLTTKELSA